MSLCGQTVKQLKIELLSLWTGRLSFAIQLSFNLQIVEGALRGISNGELKSPQLEFAFVMHLYLFCKSNLKYFPVICPVIVLCICIVCICIYICIWVRCRAEAAAVDLPAGRRLMRRPVRPLLLLQSASPTPPPVQLLLLLQLLLQLEWVGLSQPALLLHYIFTTVTNREVASSSFQSTPKDLVPTYQLISLKLFQKFIRSLMRP